MSIESEINRIKTNIENAYTVCSEKGASIPDAKNSENLAATITTVGGPTIQAVNKTASNITAGDKVWINENSSTAGSSYQFSENDGNNSSPGVIYPSGNKIFAGTYIGSLTSTAYERIGTVTNTDAWGNTRYLDNGGFVCCNSSYGCQYFDETNNVNIGEYFHIGENYFVKIDGCYQINLTTGEIQNTWAGIASNENNKIKIGNYVYDVAGQYGTFYRYSLPDGGQTVESTYNFSKITSRQLYPVDITKDNKYIICVDSYNKPSSSAGNKLKLVEVVDENTLRELPIGEMPVDLQHYYDNGSFINFNKQTGVLSCTLYGETTIMKYENGIWTKIPVDITPPESRYFRGAITFSNDLSRAVAYLNSSTWASENFKYQIYNLTTQSGYVAQLYNTSNITADTITGYAKENVVPDATFSVSVASNAPTPEPTPSNLMRLNDEYITISPNSSTYSLTSDITQDHYIISGTNKAIANLTDPFAGFYEAGKRVYITTEEITPELKAQYGDYIYDEFVMKLRIPEVAADEILNAGIILLPLTNYNRYFTTILLKVEGSDTPQLRTIYGETTGTTSDSYTVFRFKSISGYQNGDWVQIGIKPVFRSTDNLYHLSPSFYIPKTNESFTLSGDHPTGIQEVSDDYLLGWANDSTVSNIEIDLSETGFKIKDNWAVRFAIPPE